MSKFTNRNGNALILVLVVAGVGLGSLAVLVTQLGQYASQVGNSQKQASGAASDAQVLNFLMKKFDIQGKQKSEWFTAYYPSAQEMQSDRDANLASSVVTVDSLQSANLEGEDIHVNLFLVRGKVDSNQQCRPISPVITKKETNSSDCDVVKYKVDASGFGAVRAEKQDPGIDVSLAPSSIIASPNLGLLSIEDKLALSAPGAPLPLKKVMESVPITIKKRIADPGNPNKLSKFLVSVSKSGRETLALIPVPSPATPSCELSVKSAQPVRLMEGDQDVVFSIRTDSVASHAKVILPDGTDVSYESFEPYAMSGYGEFKDLKSEGFIFRIPQTKGLSMIGQPQVTFDSTYPSMQRWNMVARVSDLDGNTRDCSTSLLVDYPIDPICNVYASPSNPAPGEITNIVADCSSSGGGPVADISVVVTSDPGSASGFKKTRAKDVERQKTYNGKNYRVTEKVFEDLPTESPDIEKTYRKEYTRPETGNEKLTVVIKSLSGREQRHEIVFAQGCPFNDPGHEALLFADKSTFQDSDGLDPDSNVGGENHIGAAPDDLIFTMGNKTYTRENLTGGDNRLYTATMRSGSAASVGRGANFDSNYIVRDSYGNLPLYIIKDSDEMCASGHYCMAVERTFSIPLRSTSSASDAIKYNGLGNLDETNILSNRQYFWVEVGLSLPKGDSYDAAMAADGNAVKKDAACRPISTKRAMFRDNGGCFAGSTQVRMADGTDKKVSDVQADDWVLNPIYNSPVKVKKVVKGPEKKALWEVKYGEKRVVVTEDHPFLTKSGWVQTKVLKKGEVLIGNGQAKKVTSVKKLKYQAPEDVWNFELDTDDTYGHMVLANGIPTGDLTTQLNLKSQMKKIQ